MVSQQAIVGPKRLRPVPSSGRTARMNVVHRRLVLCCLGAALIVACSAAISAACDICAIYTGTVMQDEKTGPWVSVAEQYANFNTVLTDGQHTPNPGNEWIHSSVTQLVAGYSFTPWLGVQANVPLISREYRRLEDGVPTRGDSNGLGDVSFLVRAAPFNGPLGSVLAHVDVFAGVKTPTGNSDRLSEEMDEEEEMEPVDTATAAPALPRHAGHMSAVHGHDLALGSGSTDGIVGGNLFGSWKRVFLSMQLQYAIRSRGSFGYRYDNDLTWAGGPGVYLVTDHRWTASFQFMASGENKGKDTQYGVPANDTAITALYLGPAVGITWLDHLTASLAVDLPVVQDASGMQIVPNYRLRSGLTWRF